jgi:hypothetical protein
MELQNIDFMRILKWILIVLITGFLAQFGKSFAKYILDKIRAGRVNEKTDQGTVDLETPQRAASTPNRDIGGEVKPEIPAEAPLTEKKGQEKIQKKALKAQVKQQKKEAKKS